MKTLHDQQKNGLLIQIFLYKYKTEVTTKLLFTVIPHKLREDSGRDICTFPNTLSYLLHNYDVMSLENIHLITFPNYTQHPI